MGPEDTATRSVLPPVSLGIPRPGESSSVPEQAALKALDPPIRDLVPACHWPDGLDDLKAIQECKYV
jgi:hypothetical protein